jgi:hypothetical protein
MCDVKVFLTFTFVVKILQMTRGCWWRWFTIDVPPSSLNLVLLWQLFYLFRSSIVIKTVIVTAGTFEPLLKREVWRFKIWFNPPFLLKCLYQVRVITVFTVFRLLTDFVCLYTNEFWLSLRKIVRSSVILLLACLCYYPYSYYGQFYSYSYYGQFYSYSYYGQFYSYSYYGQFYSYS